MAIPQGSNYPDTLDTVINLHEVHDSLRLRLLEDYNPGDTEISVEGDITVFNNFPDQGYITLTEQCSDADERAISFFYTGKTQITSGTYTFDNLELLPLFTDVIKPKRITNVTQNVMAEHHGALKDAIIAIEEFVGVKGTIDTEPYGPTMEGRINFLHRLVLQPRAWFSADKRVGLAPLVVTFTDKSFQIGEGCPVDPVTHLWDFGDGDCSTISYASFISFTECPATISVASIVPINQVNVKVLDMDGGNIQKTYLTPGKYDVTLTTTNRFGSDVVIFPEYIHVRSPAPNEATIAIVERTEQIATLGDPFDGPPFDTFPQIRSPVDVFIDFEIEAGLKPGTESQRAPYGRSYGGEVLDSNGNPIDPIVNYTWELTDDLSHGNSSTARASYSVGGIYDLILRCDTANGAYRITTYEDAIDVVEQTNVWMWNFVPGTGDVKASEFGLISETFKIRPVSLTVNRNPNFLSSEENVTQLTKEFKKNTHFAQRSTMPSGNRGIAMLYWSSGREAVASPLTETIHVIEFNGFNDTYINPLTNPTLSRPWNWVGFTIYPFSTFLFGNTTTPPPPDTSPANQEALLHNLYDLGATTEALGASNYLNGADELEQNIAVFDPSTGQPEHGHFSVYRSTVKSATGYLLRNDGIGTFFRLKSFYRTEGTIAQPIQNIRKLPDMLGGTKLEGEMADLVSGVFVFNNTPAISAYNDTTGVWETGTVGSDSAAFSSLQDRTIPGFSNIENSLLVTSDHDRRAYISCDYSPYAFMKFNEINKAFTSLGARPDGEQWMLETY